MVSFNKFFSSVLLAVLYAAPLTSAAPWPPSAKIATFGKRTVGRRQIEFESFHPATTYETYAEGVNPVESFLPFDGPGDSAKAFVAAKVSSDVGNIEYTSGYSSDAADFAYLKQYHDGIAFANTAANVAIKEEKIVAFGSSFVDAASAPSSTPTIPFEEIISTAEELLDGTYNGFEAKLEYLARPDGSIALAHVIQIQNEEAATWYEAFVDAHSGEVISITDFTADAAYKVIPIKEADPRAGFQTLVDPADLAASPNGWHLSGGTSTTGNNVVAFKSSQTAVTSQTSPDQVFDYTFDPTLSPTGGENLDVARTNAFYLMNTIHDFTYRYGFTESAFNFQTDNFGKGGAGNDRVLMHVQAPGSNNANFATPPDGQSGTCNMFIWTRTTPNRDGSLQNDIPVHEMGHGISNRMTGGGTARCLQTVESRGMGEGWSDALADWTELKGAPVPNFAMALYVLNEADDDNGIRTYPYSTDKSINPRMYSDIPSLGSAVHTIGEIWATTLHGILSLLVDEYGYSDTAYTDPTGTEGNVVHLHLFLDALALQPCNPTFLSARDAWIQADQNRYGGEHVCLLWRGFADRGLGVNAVAYVNDDTVPAGC